LADCGSSILFVESVRLFDTMLPDFKRFLRYLSVAASTRALYEHYLEDFSDWVGDGTCEITGDLVLSYLDSHPAWSSSTRHSAAAALRAYCRWAYGANHEVVVQVHVRRDDPGPQRVLSADDLSRLLASFDTSTPVGLRNLSLVTFMVDSGVRASEVCRLDLQHLHLDEGYADVRVKGGKWGRACFYDYARSCLISWLGVRMKLAKPGIDAVFVSRFGVGMNRDGLRTLFRRMGEAAGLGLISPHDLRRSFATLASQAGAPDRIIQVAGRWDDINMVRRYTRSLQPEALRRWSPVNHLMGLGDDVS